MDALESLADFLKRYHTNYTASDVALSEVPGYLKCLKPCPEKGFLLCGSKEHYHTIDICGVGYECRDALGRFQSPYRLWRGLHGVVKEAQNDE